MNSLCSSTQRHYFCRFRKYLILTYPKNVGNVCVVGEWFVKTLRLLFIGPNHVSLQIYVTSGFVSTANSYFINTPSPRVHRTMRQPRARNALFIYRDVKACKRFFFHLLTVKNCSLFFLFTTLSLRSRNCITVCGDN